MLQSYLGLRDRNMPKRQLLIDGVHSTINLEEGKQFGTEYKLRDLQFSGHAAGQSSQAPGVLDPPGGGQRLGPAGQPGQEQGAREKPLHGVSDTGVLERLREEILF